MKIAAAELNHSFSSMKPVSSGGSVPQSSGKAQAADGAVSEQFPGRAGAVAAGEKQPAAANASAGVGKKEDNAGGAGSSTAINGKQLDAEALAVISELKQTDKKVRAHEAAHIAAGGQYVSGGASYEYQTGPDGKRYAVGGEVQIDTSEVPNDPEATIAKMEVVRRAALAPSNPSSQDRAVAAAATRKMSEARLEKSKETQNGEKSGDDKPVGKNFDRRA